MRPPAVLFVDGGALAPFVQLATALRRWGFRTIRVTTARRSVGSWFTRGFAFDRVVHLDKAGLADLHLVLADELLVDVHCTEHLAVDTYRSLERRPAHRADGWRNRADLIDKWNALGLLDEIGIEHPHALPGSTSASEAVGRLGLPVVVKPRIGANGHGIFVARDLAELERHAQGIDTDDVFFEAFVEGTAANYCGIAGEGAERDMTYRTIKRGAQAWSPSIEVVCYRDDELTELGRRLVAALPCRGLVNFDVIRDARGRHVVHDINLRTWSAFLASRHAGIDLTAAYLRWLGDLVRRSVGDEERSIRLFPDYAGTALLTGRRAVGLRALAEQAGEYRRWLGSRYVLRELARSGRALLVGERKNDGAEHR